MNRTIPARRHAALWLGFYCVLVASCGIVAEPASYTDRWYEERQKIVLRDFYGYQVRVLEHWEQLEVQRRLKIKRWWEWEERRVMAREQARKRDVMRFAEFLRMQMRREHTSKEEQMRDVAGEQALFAVQERTQENKRRAALRQEESREQLLRNDHIRREREAQDLERFLDEQARRKNRSIKQGRGVF